MRLRFLLLVAILALFCRPSPASNLHGRVVDLATGEPLAAANIRLHGTSRGTITNPDGEFSLPVDDSHHVIIVSMLGYAPDTVAFSSPAAEPLLVSLRASEILLPEVVVTAEDPAMGIVRRAILHKKEWTGLLRTYEMKAFTRQRISRDTAVASITESYTTGYWQAGDTLREVVTQRRQTANIPPGMNFAAVGRLLNFNDDEISFAGFRFVGPIAEDAFDYYTYKLIRTRAGHGDDVYEIAMTPKTRTAPLFSGTLMISGRTYALAGVDVVPNAAFRIPFLRDVDLRYRQQFALFDSTFWMPVDIRIDGSFLVGIPGISIPRLGFSQTSVISDYAINVPLPDSLFHKARLVIDSNAVHFDSTFWLQATPLPLSEPEKRAYETLDSTQRLDVQFRPRGLLISLGDTPGGLGDLLSTLDLSFNRVEGFHLGLARPFDLFSRRARLEAGWAYSTALKRPSYNAGLTLYTDSNRTFGVGVHGYRKVEYIPDRGYYGSFANGLSSLLWKLDYRDYYGSDGGRITVSARPSDFLRTDVSYLLETHEPLLPHTDYSLFRRSASYRPNPQAAAGSYRSLLVEAFLGAEPVPLDLVLQPSLRLTVEHASRGMTAGDFAFTRYDAVATLAIPTFGRSFFLHPGFRLRASAGTSAGTLPVQRAFFIETSTDGYAPFGTMRALGVKESYGTGYAAISLEHNFRSLPFLALGIPFLYENGIELILHGGAARLWGNPGTPTPSMRGTYTEAGFSISRLFDLLRADFTWQTSAGSGFTFTLGVAPLF
jgi:hypothetical protein